MNNQKNTDVKHTVIPIVDNYNYETSQVSEPIKETPLEVRWKEIPEEHDYPAAASYLNLIFGKKTTNKIVKKLEKSKMHTFKAKDIFRASKLSLLGVSNSHVVK